ncbi:pyridine nucleotide-disulfide oxidoreductase [Subtercola boreus]|uniref:Pyridine nucleotide-disulfide oxidoreductase n=2 Tax=Subtercola boreus TaxID=120213 RepID=A0A3E0VVZ3_9MICO|nr:pyridine nucleotide-disulfide oxidoreductase [Subtercola boreus]
MAEPHSPGAAGPADGSPLPAIPAHARVVVVGAGQAGLSVAHHLAHGGLAPGQDLVVLDRSPAAGGAWQFRWESLRLGTAHRVNDLPGMRELGLSFETADQGRAARDVVGEYYAEYERHFGLAVFRPVAVTSVREAARGAPRSGSLRIDYLRGVGDDATRGTVIADVLVNATGTWGAPIRPYIPGIETFRGRQLSTPEYRSAAEFRGQRVIVVGGGTSAVGFVLELEGIAASTTWVTRRPVAFASDEPGEASASIEGRLAAVAQQNDAARAGRVLPSIISGTGLPATARNLGAARRGVLVARPPFTSIEPGGVRFADGSFEPADVIIWATGFRSELGHLDTLGLREPGGGVAATEGRAVRNPRVFLAGYGPQASTIGANRAGRLVALQVLEALS